MPHTYYITQDIMQGLISLSIMLLLWRLKSIYSILHITRYHITILTIRQQCCVYTGTLLTNLKKNRSVYSSFSFKIRKKFCPMIFATSVFV